MFPLTRLFARSLNSSGILITLASLLLVSLPIVGQSKTLHLIGGGLKVCSSYSSKYCSEKVSFGESAFTENKYQITERISQSIEQDQFKLFSQSEQRGNLLQLLNKYFVRHPNDIVNRRSLLKKLDELTITSTQLSGRKILDDLNQRQFSFLLDNLQKAPVDKKGKPLTEYVDFQNSHPDTQIIISRFVEDVKKTSVSKRPLILVSTASASDVFDAVSFYMQLFKSFDVDVAWLPIEASLNAVMNDSNLSCNDIDVYRGTHFSKFNREVVYPHLTDYQQQFCKNPDFFKDLVQRASGLFFNGGDQFLTLSSLAHVDEDKKLFSSLYAVIKQRFDDGDLVIAGTSAGSAVQSGGHLKTIQQKQGKKKNSLNKTAATDIKVKLPMITNGQSIPGFFIGSNHTATPPSSICEQENTCGDGITANSLTSFKVGGFDFISIGLIDTHFSERDRAFRMIRLMLDNHLAKGYGVDENTALIVNIHEGLPELEVLGQGAVWSFDSPVYNNKDSKVTKTSSSEMRTLKVELTGIFSEKSHVKLQDRLGSDVVARLVKRSLNNHSKLVSAPILFESYSANITLDASIVPQTKGQQVKVHITISDL
jgi:cyanophycinase-like exopeptidase